MKNKIKIVAFDCDGVMFDTINTNREYYNHVLRYMDKPDMSPEQLKYVHMHSAEDSIAYLFKETEEYISAAEYRRSMSYRPFLKQMNMEPYLKILLKKLKSDFNIAIATNRSDTMDLILSTFGLTEYFDLIITSLDVKNPKPDPEVLLKILEQFNAKPEEMIYIGDSKLDQKASRAAVVKFIAYDNLSLDADFHISSLQQVEDVLGLVK